MPSAVFVHDAQRTPSYRNCGLDVVTLLSEAARPIVERYRRSIDCLLVSCQDPSSFNQVNHLAAAICDNLGLVGIEATRVENASNSIGVVTLACKAALCGSNVLVIGGELMNDPSVSPGRREEIIAQVVPAKDRAYGVTMPAAVALITSYFAGYHGIGADRLRRILEEIAVLSYHAASFNRYAQLRGEKFRKDNVRKNYRSERNRPLCEPLHFYDVCPTTDGSGAILLSCNPVLEQRKARVKITGHALVNDFNRIIHRNRLEALAASEIAAQRAYAMAGIPVEYRNDGTFYLPEYPPGFFAEIHDAFGPLYLLNLLNLGMYGLAQAEDAILSGKTDPTSADCLLPINPSGGLKDGHPVGGTGLIKMVETYWQLVGQPNGLDLRKAPFPFEPRTAVVHSVGGPGSVNGVVVMEHVDNDPRPAIWPTRIPPVTAAKRTFQNADFPKPGRFVASTRRHFYAAAGSRSTPPAESIDIGMVELWEDGKPGPRKLAIPMDDRSLTFGDGVRVWKSYRDGRYHFERDYPDRH
ncbi:MAG TPA: thiolase family protein [Polyangiaceae bacterium]|jgi:acetyl-CoA acetyltransferase|nr:MAG: acetyl-CoA acetyltransferase [Deltaproteobacteria bacterium ADurb.Bin207]HNS97864.1 thiolase family protein [Polyangiaceae bacterium]HNZ25086.1 thiolase family protein [Polyangiaceae bacterium]HOD24108.1 thiolase family protein [Polyangiaceae bacterium]HOE50364.1 thiolase family protein [Polyangiaceae bacterium]